MPNSIGTAPIYLIGFRDLPLGIGSKVLPSNSSSYDPNLSSPQGCPAMYRDTDEMEVIFYETVGPYFQSVFSAVGCEPFYIMEVIPFFFKDTVAVIASLGNVMGKGDSHCP